MAAPLLVSFIATYHHKFHSHSISQERLFTFRHRADDHLSYLDYIGTSEHIRCSTIIDNNRDIVLQDKKFDHFPVCCTSEGLDVTSASQRKCLTGWEPRDEKAEEKFSAKIGEQMIAGIDPPSKLFPMDHIGGIEGRRKLRQKPQKDVKNNVERSP